MKPSSLRCVLLAGLPFLGWCSTQAQAATLTVANLNDSGTGSLREAITSANATPDADTIVFAPTLTGTLALTGGELTLNSDLSIVGPNSSELVLSGNRNSRIFNIAKGNVSLSNLILANGFVAGEAGTNGTTTGNPTTAAGGVGGNAHGGAIFNKGILTLVDVFLKSNGAQGGTGGRGGIARFSSPWGPGGSAGPWGPWGPWGPSRPTLATGGAGGSARGGAIFNTGTLKLIRARFQGNVAQGGQGGAGGQYGPSYPVTTWGLGGKGGNAYGGAIFNGGTLEMDGSSDQKSSFSTNRAIAGLGGQGRTRGVSGSSFDGDIRDVMPSAQDAAFSGMAKVAFKEQLIATAGEPLTYSLVSGTLPPGLTLAPNTGIISGTPTALSNAQVTFRVNDGFRNSNTATITFNIRPYKPEVKSLIVTTLSDTENIADNLTSLREAVAYAHTLPGLPIITFAPELRGTIILTKNALVTKHDLSIVGPLSSSIVLDGNLQDRIVYVQSGTANISNLTFTRGTESAILNHSTLNLSNCTLHNNSGKGGGGGLYSGPNTSTSISNCTFVENKDFGGAAGGGIYNGGRMTIDSSTLWRNTCVGGRGGGICNEGQLVLRNSIVAGSVARFGPDVYGTLAGGDYNLIQDPAGATLVGTHNIIGQSANLAPLSDNGGPTPTMALLAGSPAINAGQTSLLTDQRGEKRFAGVADIGAFEAPLPTISVNSPSVREGNGDTDSPSQLVFTLTLSKASAQSVSVMVQTTNALTTPATAKSDYTPLARRLVTFAPAQTRQTVSVAVVGDRISEGNERVGLLLTSAVGATLAAAPGEGTIVDDDALPALSINNISLAEGNSSFSKAVFTVTLSAPSERVISVGYKTYSNGRGVAIGGTPTTASVDYLAIPTGTLTFSPGQTSKTITVFVKGDTLLEGNEPFVVLLSAPVNARVADGTGLGTILNDDGSGTTTSSLSAPTY